MRRYPARDPLRYWRRHSQWRLQGRPDRRTSGGCIPNSSGPPVDYESLARIGSIMRFRRPHRHGPDFVHGGAWRASSWSSAWRNPAAKCIPAAPATVQMYASCAASPPETPPRTNLEDASSPSASSEGDSLCGLGQTAPTRLEHAEVLPAGVRSAHTRTPLPVGGIAPWKGGLA